MRARVLLGAFALASACLSSKGDPPPHVTGCKVGTHGVTKLAYHGGGARLGWNDAEPILTPASIASGNFGPIWESSPFDAAPIGGAAYPGRAYASPLYADDVTIKGGRFDGQTLSLVIAATTNGTVYAINASATPCDQGETPAGAEIWKTQLGTPGIVPRLDAGGAFGGVQLGVLSTPILDASASRLYVVSMDAPPGATAAFKAYALDLASGAVAPGWPITLDASSIEPVNTNGPTPWDPDVRQHSQRSALALSPSGDRLYVAFGGYYDASAGWIVAVDTARARVAASFSGARGATIGVANAGMWSAGGPAVDDDGTVYVTTGNGPAEWAAGNAAKAWGNSFLALTRDLVLRATYTPWNFCQSEIGDTDLGGGAPLLVPTLDATLTATPRLVSFASKQGVVYLVDRDAIPGGADRRPTCTATATWSDAAADKSLLPPAGAPYCNPADPSQCAAGPLSVFGPYSDDAGANDVDHAKMRTTPAFFRDAAGTPSLFVAGSSKATDDLTPAAPALARLRLHLAPGQPAFLGVDATARVSFVNPGSPVVTSNQGATPVVWVVDQNARRTQPMLDPSTPHPILVAIDGTSMAQLYASGPTDLSVGGKYVTPAIAHGVVLVATDRVQAFGLRAR